MTCLSRWSELEPADGTQSGPAGGPTSRLTRVFDDGDGGGPLVGRQPLVEGAHLVVNHQRDERRHELGHHLRVQSRLPELLPGESATERPASERGGAV